MMFGRRSLFKRKTQMSNSSADEPAANNHTPIIALARDFWWVLAILVALPLLLLTPSCLRYLSRESAEVRKMKVKSAMAIATDRINSLNKPEGRVSPTQANEAKEAVVNARKLLEKYAELDSAITFEFMRGSYEREQAISLRKADSIRDEFSHLVPKIMSFLGDEAERIGRENEQFKQKGGPGESLEELRDQLFKGNVGLNQELFSIVAWIRDTTAKRIIDQLTGHQKK
jgi:hypothetical protein